MFRRFTYWDVAAALFAAIGLLLILLFVCSMGSILAVGVAYGEVGWALLVIAVVFAVIAICCIAAGLIWVLISSAPSIPASPLVPK